jgi:hypothetical protein
MRVPATYTTARTVGRVSIFDFDAHVSRLGTHLSSLEARCLRLGLTPAACRVCCSQAVRAGVDRDVGRADEGPGAPHPPPGDVDLPGPLPRPRARRAAHLLPRRAQPGAGRRRAGLGRGRADLRAGAAGQAEGRAGHRRSATRSPPSRSPREGRQMERVRSAHTHDRTRTQALSSARLTKLSAAPKGRARSTRRYRPRTKRR